MKVTHPDVIKAGERDLIDSIADDLDWDAVKNLLTDRIKKSTSEVRKGEIIVHEGKIAFRVDLEVKTVISLMFDREGNYIAGEECSVSPGLNDAPSEEALGYGTSQSHEAHPEPEDDLEGVEDVPEGSEDDLEGSEDDLEGVEDVPEESEDDLGGVEDVPEGSEDHLEGLGDVPEGSEDHLEGLGDVPEGIEDHLEELGDVPEGIEDHLEESGDVKGAKDLLAEFEQDKLLEPAETLEDNEIADIQETGQEDFVDPFDDDSLLQEFEEDDTIQNFQELLSPSGDENQQSSDEEMEALLKESREFWKKKKSNQ